MPDPITATAQPGLLFVPDISGFTKFVNETAISHSQHIIAELLEKLIDANELGLEVSEVEGDAILFYRFGEAPSAAAFFAQVQRMFVAFHGHLRLYETQRICRCGACSSANQLTLKIVAHHGTLSQNRVKQHVKLFGADVIATHRLLKNDIAHHEYVLFTRPLADSWAPDAAAPWALRESGSGNYDVGRLEYGYVALAPLRKLVPEPKTEDFSIPGVSVHAFSCEEVIDAPLELVFEVAIDLPVRLSWIHKAKDVELLDRGLNRVGTRHRCVVDATSPVLVTSGVSHSADSITFTETDDKRMACAVFGFHRVSEARTRVRIDFLIRNSLIVKALFALLLKRKLAAQFPLSLRNLKRHCEKRHASPAA